MLPSLLIDTNNLIHSIKAQGKNDMGILITLKYAMVTNIFSAVKTLLTGSIITYVERTAKVVRTGEQLKLKLMTALTTADFLRMDISKNLVSMIRFINGISQAYNFKTLMPLIISLMI